MIKFNSLQQVEVFKFEHGLDIETAITEACNVDSVEYAEFWGCKTGAWIVSFDSNDEIINKIEFK